MGDGLQDGSQRLEADGNVQKMSREEEWVKVTNDRQQEIPELIQESLKKNINVMKFIKSR